jgi:hypothetical protein
MKGFKNSTRMKSGFSFPADKGFSGSTGKLQTIGGYTRAKPMRKATGGKVDSSMTSRAQPVTTADAESGGRSPLRPGFSRGGRTKGC